LATALHDEGVEVTVIVINQSFQEVFEDNGISIHALKPKKRSLGQWYFSRKDYNTYINSLVKEKNIDILEAPDWTGITAFMRFTCPLVVRFHGSDTYFCHLDKRKQKFKNYLIEKLAVKGADAFIAPTTYAGQVSKELFKITDRTVKIIHYGLFLEAFNNNSPETYIHGSILYLGTLIRKKGVFELTKIFNSVVEQNPEAKLILIGNDSADLKTNSSSTWELMKAQFSQEALKRVDYKGKVPYEAVQGHIKSAHVCVFPTFAETLGMVTIESMALQRPVVNTNYGWAQELIDDGVNGYLVDPENTKEYASKIVQLLSDSKLTEKIGSAARIKVETTFDIKSLVKDNIAYYKSLLS
jgi:glycosyltransferase involved in cell wall biosynthesis